MNNLKNIATLTLFTLSVVSCSEQKKESSSLQNQSNKETKGEYQLATFGATNMLAVATQVEDPHAQSGSSRNNKELVSDDTPISFNEHIQPILSANCYHCHGPDSGTRFPEDEPYRLDNAEGAFEVRKNGKSNIIKGDPDNSYLIELMESKDPDMVMPLHPSKSPHGKIMDPADIALVRRWVKEGAVYEDHWAYIPSEKAELPEVKNKDWARNEIDYFILSKLEQKNLQPNSDSDKGKLLRRLTFDLTGLPPTAEEIKAFTTDTRDFETVYSEKVDALLQTDAYAEHFARHWLDVARYSDTHGIHKDNYRSIWPYRDWVINAFRENMKFDQFTREQIAGDLFPNATIDQTVATGFHRCLPTTGEGGAIPEEYDAIYAQDRVNTTASAWLGLTAGCAACHDHKFDAISTKENYELTAFFRNTTMEPVNKGDNKFHPPNVLVIKKGKHRDAYDQIIIKENQLKAQRATHRKSHEGGFKQWLTDKKKSKNGVVTELPGILVNLPIDDKAKGLNNPEFTSKSPLIWKKGFIGDAVLFDKANYINLKNNGDFEQDQAFSVNAMIKGPPKSKSSIISKIDTNKNSRGYELSVENGRISFSLNHHANKNAIRVTTVNKVPIKKWMHVLATYDGSKKASGIKIYIKGKPVALRVNSNTLTKTIKNEAPLLLGARLNGNTFTNGQIQAFQIYDRVLTPEDAITVSSGRKMNQLIKTAKLQAKQMSELREFYFTSVDTESIKIQQRFNKIQQEKARLLKHGTLSLVMDDRHDQEPEAYILIRGDYQKKGDRVTPNTPASLPPMPEDKPKNRLGLAYWLTDPENPLPARVTVNRYWSYLFGAGIVSSNGDFGVMGSRPTHPKLLDWLSVDFVENGWDFHHLLKKMVTSSTYRQSALFSKEKIELDPENKYYARAPRYRLDAEQIRDLALSSSSLMHHQVGGPSVKPYMPPNIWESVAMKDSNTRRYKRDKGNNLYRRSIYTFMKRTAQHPMMEIFNAPAREESCVQRDLTNTPLQAFVIMNDPQIIESSRNLASIAIKQGATTKERINLIGLKLIAREMSDDEIAIIEDTLNKTLEDFKSKPEEAKKLIGVGDSKPPEDQDAVELASWTIITNQIFNMDETLNK